MYWTSEHARQLKNDLSKLLQDPAHKHQFIESVPFDLQTGEYNIFVRQLLKSEVVEVDTYEDLLNLKGTHSEIFYHELEELANQLTAQENHNV